MQDHKADMMINIHRGNTWHLRLRVPARVYQIVDSSPLEVCHDVIVSRQPNPAQPSQILLSVTQVDATEEVTLRRRETKLLKEILPEHVL